MAEILTRASSHTVSAGGIGNGSPTTTRATGALPSGGFPRPAFTLGAARAICFGPSPLAVACLELRLARACTPSHRRRCRVIVELVLNGLQLRLLNWIAPSMPAAAASDYVRRSSIESVLPGIADRVVGKVVLDFGCGGGSDAIHLAQLGAARVTGIDIQEHWLVRARKRALEAGLSEDRCAFATSTSDLADLIVCLDSFEHFADPAEALRQMHALLRPGGSLLLSFGGGWYHPRGGHSFSVFLWAHLLFSERALIQWRSRHKSDGATRFSEIAGGLNQMTLRRFERLARESAFQIVSVEYVPIRRTRWLHNRLTREFLTALVRCELMRPS